MTTEQTIPLNQLVHSTANVRRTDRSAGIEALAASIAAHGLRQNLNVRPTDSGKFEVVAGGRRLRALRLLAKQGGLASNAPVRCLVMADEDAAEISLAENVLREAMHPDDQFAAFLALIEDKGMGIEDVAARFGVTPALVERRLKLARVSPKLRALYRKGDLSLEQVMAFTVSDDHAQQERVWKDLSHWNSNPRSIREALLGEAMPASHRLARFVGLEAYIAAGGAVIHDLFSTKDEGFLADRERVMHLATEKLEAAAKAVQAEGWKWVKVEPEPDYMTRYGRIAPLADTGDGDTDERFSPEDMARAGARLRIGHDGELEIARGLIHPDDMERDTEGGGPGQKEPRDPATLPASLVEELTAHRSAALRIELAQQPAMGLAATVHALALSQLYDEGLHGAATCLAIRAGSEELARYTKAPEECGAYTVLQSMERKWRDILPEEADDLWHWCLSQPQEVLLALLAYLAALSVNAVRLRQYGGMRPALTHADRLAEALHLDMVQYWTPSVDGFYARLSKAALAAAASEASDPLNTAKILAMKKQEAAQRIHRALQGSGWLPAPLRRSLSGIAAGAA